MKHINYNNAKEKPELNLMTIGALPPEILIDILSRLPVNSICCMRCVSKALLKMVDDLSFSTLHMRRRFLTTCSTPQLVVLNESSYDKYDMLYPLNYRFDSLTKSEHAIVSYFGSKGRFYSSAFVFCNLFGFTGLNPEHGRSCLNGLYPEHASLSLRVNFFPSLYPEHRRSCLLVNPFKGEVLMLPSASDVQVPTNSLCSVDWYGMGFDNITNSFKIVRVSTNKKDYVAAEVLVLGTSSWRELPTVPPCFPTCKSAYTHGDMHWLVYGDDASSVRILSFDFKKEEFYMTPHPTFLGEKPGLWNFLHLLNFRGSLTLVNVSSPEKDHVNIWRPYVEIWGLKNYDNKEWVQNYKIHSEPYLFTFWEPTRLSKCGEWEHGIFFIQKIPPNNHIIFVDVRHVSIKHILLRGGITVHSCTDDRISLNNYGDLVEAEEEQGIIEFPISRETWKNLIDAAEEEDKPCTGKGAIVIHTHTNNSKKVKQFRFNKVIAENMLTESCAKVSIFQNY
ncbi:hypothetical protein PRUPE_2G096000 [Prunus persica]|uniref:F-box domain-containing protein n=1 Tax=Prunus persica TaxID=3760 RepID=A0A251QEP9_PRUPE|nr:hypothetical protein PRUPE_2G096000 [Prunus persica]